jgi:hypothetical protein
VRFLLREWQAGRAGLKMMGRQPSSLNGSESLSTCEGGLFPHEGFNGFCAGESVGVLCRACSARHYFDSTKQRCAACPSAARINWAPIATTVPLLIGLYALHHYMNRPESKTFLCIDAALSMLSRTIVACRVGTFMAQLKIFVTFCQIMMAMPNVCNIRVPPFFPDVASPAKVFDVYQWIVPVDSACIGTLLSQLLAFGLAPLVLSVLHLMVVMIVKYVHRHMASCGLADPNRLDRGATLMSSFLHIVPASLFILFLCATTVSDKIFDVFDCIAVETDSLLL